MAKNKYIKETKFCSIYCLVWMFNGKVLFNGEVGMFQQDT